MPDDKEVLSDGQEGGDWIPLQAMPDEDEILPD